MGEKVYAKGKKDQLCLEKGQEMKEKTRVDCCGKKGKARKSVAVPTGKQLGCRCEVRAVGKGK